MSEITFPINFNLDGFNSYWLHMEIKEDPDEEGMTVAEAADLIDAIFNIDICNGTGQSQNTYNPSSTSIDLWNNFADQEIDPSILDPLNRFAQELLANNHLDNCKAVTVDDLKSYDVTIKVFRSHCEELYKLQISNGTARNPVKHADYITHVLELEDADSYTFDNPIISKAGIRSPVMKWEGDTGPEITINGNTIFWKGNFTGTLRAEFYTEWDEIVITVTGDPTSSSMITGTDPSIFGTGWYSGSETGKEIDDYQNIECSVLAFYHYQYEELLLNRPEIELGVSSEISNAICDTTAAIFSGSTDREPRVDDDGNPIMCRKHVNDYVVCQCDGQERHESYYEEVPCPVGYNAGSTVSGSRDTRTYKDCGYRDEAHDPEVYLEKCCEEWPFDHSMPQCKKVVTRYNGDIEKDFKESDYPEGTEFIPVAPTDGQCGEHTVEQVMHAKDCCGTVPPMSFTKSVSQVTSDESYLFCVTGGAPPYTWQAAAESGGLSISGSSECALLYVSECFCKFGTIRVTDSCNQYIETYVDSIDGSWILQSTGECGYSGHFSEFMGSGTNKIITVDNGTYKQQERWAQDSISGDIHYELEGFDNIEDYVCSLSGGTPSSEPCLVNDRAIHACSNGKTFITYKDGEEVDYGVTGKGFRGILEWQYVPLSHSDLALWKWKCHFWEMEYDEENSVEIIADDSFGVVYVTGGKAPYIWEVTGQGFYLDETCTLTEAQTSVPEITIYTENCCGSGSISVTDVCDTTVDGNFKSTEGDWELLDKFRSRDQIGNFDGVYHCVTNIYSWFTSIPILQDIGKYRLVPNSSGIDLGINYVSGMHPWCSCEDKGAEDYLDPIIGLFTVKGLIGYNHDRGSHDGCETSWRLGYYLSPVTNSEIHVLKWRC